MGGNLIKKDGVFDAVEEEVLLVSETPEGAGPQLPFVLRCG